MAKSLRSKWRRKMKAIKRERYGKKELEKLKSIIDGSKRETLNDIDLAELQQLVTVVPCPKKSDVNTSGEENDVDQQMEVDQKVKIYDPLTLQDQHGNFPVWMSSHKKKKVIKQIRKANKIKKKKIKCKSKK